MTANAIDELNALDLRGSPRDDLAERGVIGSCIIDPDVLDDVVLVIRERDFYAPTHQAIFRAMLELHENGKRPDPTLLFNHLKKTGRIEVAGGLAYLAEVADAVPTAHNAIYYAQIVRDHAILRDIIDVGASMLHMAKEATSTEARELIGRAERTLFGVLDARQTNDAHRFSDVLIDAMNDLENRIENKGVAGLRVGFSDLDELIGGLRGGELVILAARPGMGKAQPLDASVLTPSGFVVMGEVKVGDEVIGSSGHPCKVVAIHPRGELPVFRVSMTDGSATECCGDHLWFTQTRNERRSLSRGSVKRTSEIIETVLRADGDSPNHALPIVRPVQFKQGDGLIIDPYVMGLLLGDGSFGSTIRFCKPEADLIEQLSQSLHPDDALTIHPNGRECRIRRRIKGTEQSETKKAITHYGLDGCSSTEKFIPQDYLFASEIDRTLLLRGLMDTDGFVTSSGQSVEFTTSSPRLAKDVAFLARSLGGIVSCRVRVPIYAHGGEKKRGAPSSRMVLMFPSGLVPVASKKHLSKWRFTGTAKYRSIASIEPIGYKRCQCITVSESDGLYVTDDFILTHNSALATNLMERVAMDAGKTVLFFSLEMHRLELSERIVCGRARVNSKRARNGILSSDDCARMTEQSNLLSPAPIFIDDAPSRTVSEIAAVCRRQKRRYGLDLVIVDYLQRIHPEDSRVPREQQVAGIATRLKTIAREVNVPVICLAQLNRQVEGQADKRPRLSHLRESGAIEQEADQVWFIHRPDYYELDDAKHTGLAELYVEKNRAGATGKVDLCWFPEWTRFETRAREEQQGMQHTPRNGREFDADEWHGRRDDGRF